MWLQRSCCWWYWRRLLRGFVFFPAPSASVSRVSSPADCASDLRQRSHWESTHSCCNLWEVLCVSIAVWQFIWQHAVCTVAIYFTIFTFRHRYYHFLKHRVFSLHTCMLLVLDNCWLMYAKFVICDKLIASKLGMKMLYTYSLSVWKVSLKCELNNIWEQHWFQ